MHNLTSLSAGAYDRRRKSGIMATYSISSKSRQTVVVLPSQVLSVHVSRLKLFFSMLVLLLCELNFIISVNISEGA